MISTETDNQMNETESSELDTHTHYGNDVTEVILQISFIGSS